MFLFMPLFYHCGTKRKTVKHALAQRSTAGKLYTFLVISKKSITSGQRSLTGFEQPGTRAIKTKKRSPPMLYEIAPFLGLN